MVRYCYICDILTSKELCPQCGSAMPVIPQCPRCGSTRIAVERAPFTFMNDELHCKKWFPDLAYLGEEE